MDKKKILIGSPIHQKPEILKEFLECLSCLRHDNYNIDYLFYDDNKDDESKALLKRFSIAVENSAVRSMERSHEYQCDENTHHWSEPLIWKVAGFKDEMIAHARENGYDYLFLIDSDILLEPSAIEQLVAAEKDIVSEVFWTAWYPGAPPLPNVWFYDHYDMVPRSREEKLTAEESFRRQSEFLKMLKNPGIYEVGMLGACTLLSRKALLSGISFQPLYNLSMWGEDRHFCIRAAALGFKLYADTHCKAFHIYRESDLDQARVFRQETGIADSPLKLALYPDFHCPVCGSDGIAGFHDYTSFKLLVCNDCGLKFRAACRNMDIKSLISETYGPSWIQMREQYSRDTFLGHAKFNNMLLEISRPQKGSLLEIGSGTGEFLFMAKEAGWQVAGVEPGMDACRYAREKFGLELECAVWGESAIQSNATAFDAIAFWHVLEHIADPASFLRSVYTVLKPDGLLFFSLPNDDSLFNEVYGKTSALYREPDHLMHYNRRNLAILLEKAGFEAAVLFTRQEPDGLDIVCRQQNGDKAIAFEELMGTASRLQSGFRGYELVCIAHKRHGTESPLTQCNDLLS
jgi:SAM-dependent methyltransferase/GT2 family glycosyltransferase